MTIRRLLFPLLTLLVGFALVACQTATTTLGGPDYDDFDYIEDYDEVFNRREGTYIVYLYSESCYTCNSIKDEVLAFAGAYADRTIYFLNVDNATATKETVFLTTLGKNEVGTPTLLLIKDSGFDKNASSRYFFTGSSPILSIINDLENGDYPYWN
ncbi:MAG: thioredoxin family protein [Candidatus Izemoplasmatales bacterium]